VSEAVKCTEQVMDTDESARLAALRSYRILDTEPERAFDDLVLLASQICATPISLISLVDEDRQWFKARIGVSLSETSRSVSFCSQAIKGRGIFVVDDALEDVRFRENALVHGEPHIRFYAGAPLITSDGHALGTLCILDHVPRTLTDGQRRALDALRRQAEAQLELRRNLIDLGKALAERNRAEAAKDALLGELRRSLQKVDKLSAMLPLSSNCEINLTVPATPQGIQTVCEGVMQLLQNKQWPENDVIKVDLALQEALANGIRHGCKGDPSKHVQCTVTFDASGDLVIVVRDPGSGFDSTALPNPLAADNILKSSGRGVFLINQLMDEVAFRDGGREVEMKKRRDPKAGQS
jgi:anti-sigma regulatory factor (Ser/Thr protein kinase)